ncbi:DMT family transporter [Arsenicicoccus sp. oral taxon 190]|uniref:DMT family transporter n=1 Tax=Arsenicicoccus sp. oral taxon 190 TaxID=1658671 RepID=UPI00067A0777|nr:DMT family transporter [Arsenicicoccus sp. oral taxon 190]AKT52039.1 permease [Arsenicicoccus sp. oral taxon 190]
MDAPSRAGTATLALVGVTAVWGSTFYLIHDLLDTMDPLDFLAVRFTIAAVCLLLVFGRSLRRLDRRAWVAGLVLGVVYALAQVLQTVGLAHTSASRSGFITGLYVVLTPLLAAVVLRDRVGRATWVAAVLSVGGLGVLSLGPDGLAIGLGELLTLLCAGVYAVHILGVGRYTRAELATALATVQMIALAVGCSAAAALDGVRLPPTPGAWGAVLYMAIVAGAGALWAQTWAQAHLSATRAAIVMTLEPVFAAGFAVLLGGESLTGRMLLGGGLILAAMYLVELAGRRGRGADDDAPPLEALHHEP